MLPIDSLKNANMSKAFLALEILDLGGSLLSLGWFFFLFVFLFAFFLLFFFVCACVVPWSRSHVRTVH